MRSRVNCHPTQVNTSRLGRLNPSQTGRYSIYLPLEKWKAELTLETGYKFNRNIRSDE